MKSPRKQSLCCEGVEGRVRPGELREVPGRARDGGEFLRALRAVAAAAAVPTAKILPPRLVGLRHAQQRGPPPGGHDQVRSRGQTHDLS